MISQNTPNKLNRRKWLRDAAIATTSAAVLPSLLTNCTDHPVNPGSGLVGGASAPPVDTLYPQAAHNIKLMRDWSDNLFSFTQAYEGRVWAMLKSGVEPTDWTKIFVEVFVDIGLEILGAALEEFPLVGATIAAAASQIEKWAEEKGRGVDAAFGGFKAGYDDMMFRISNELLTLQSSDGNYAALQKAFKGGELIFNGKKYTIQQLAEERFPDANLDAEVTRYKQMRYAAYIRFQKSIWATMILQGGDFTSYFWGIVSPYNLPCIRDYALREFYNKNDPAYTGGYFLGKYNRNGNVVPDYNFRWWTFLFDGKALSPEAAKELFIDDIKGNLLHPDQKDKPKDLDLTGPPTGLWPRYYVYQQFHKEQQNFYDYREILNTGGCDEEKAFGELVQNTKFEGWDIKKLIEK